MVIDLHGVDQRSQIGLAERYRTFGDVGVHELAETSDPVRAQPPGYTPVRDPLQGGLRPVAVGLERCNALLQHIVEVGETILHQFIEPPELVFRRSRFTAQVLDPALDLGIGLQAPVGNGLEQGLQSFGEKNALSHMLGHQPVELVHGDRAALAGCLAHAGRGRAIVVAIDPPGL
ncbi:hypothetical protein [Xanthobacter oligotrophicus]|uniref:hypothetical protein n=1 Tax=Xanthobacter oligotrophicus TaxID=2607286 RepID=UPI002F266C3C